MCGNVAYWGFSNGITKILNALALLAYRAPDSSGLAVVGSDGAFVVRRCGGDSQQLQALLAAAPLPPLLHDIPQVVVVHDPEATKDFATRADRNPAMVARALPNLTAKATAAGAWLSLVTPHDSDGRKGRE